MSYLKGLFCLAVFMVVCPLGHGEAHGQDNSSVYDERLIPLIKVDTHSISLGVFKKSYVDYLILTGANDTEGNRQKHIQSLTDAYLMGDYARKNGGVKDSAFVKFIEVQRKKVLGGRFYELEVLDKIDSLTEDEKRIAYARYKSRVHVRQLYFTRAENAERYYKRLESGEDFIDLANEVYQTAIYDSSAGDMGYISYFDVDDALAEAAYSLERQFEYSQPVQSRKGYHILRLENRIASPFLSESAYQVHGKGVAEDMQLRKIRLQGNAFIRQFMDSLYYTTNEQAIRALSQRVRMLVTAAQENPSSLFLEDTRELTLDESEVIQEILTPQTVLITYTWQGQDRVFTAGDFYDWLQDVPYAELKSNPTASIGRALRNEVLSLAGQEAGLDEDPIVQESMVFEEQLYLAREVKQALRQDTTIRPTEEMVQSAFDRLTENRDKSIIVDYWTIETTSLEDALLVRDHIEEGKEQPANFSTYQQFSGEDIFINPEWTSHLRQAPLSTTMTAGLRNNRWFVFNVTKREQIPYVFEEVQTSLEKQLAPYSGEYFLLQQLYQAANINIDETQFEAWPTR